MSSGRCDLGGLNVGIARGGAAVGGQGERGEC